MSESSRVGSDKTRERTRYTLTAKGRRALVAWMDEPVRFSRIQLEPAWRVLAADIVGEEAALRGVAGLREEIADLHARLDVAEAAAATLPHREKYLMLNHRLARSIVDAHAEWLDAVEDELGPPPRRSR